MWTSFCLLVSIGGIGCRLRAGKLGARLAQSGKSQSPQYGAASNYSGAGLRRWKPAPQTVPCAG